MEKLLSLKANMMLVQNNSEQESLSTSAHNEDVTNVSVTDPAKEEANTSVEQNHSPQKSYLSIQSSNMSSQPDKKKKIPGISFILILAMKNELSKRHLLQYDCVLCNGSNSELLDSTAMKAHVKSRKHLLHILEIENHENFEMYKNHSTVTEATLLAKAFICQSSSERVIATAENFEAKRKILSNKITQLRSVHSKSVSFKNLAKTAAVLQADQRTPEAILEEDKIDVKSSPSNEILLNGTVKAPTKEISSPSEEDKIVKVVSPSTETLLKRTVIVPTKHTSSPHPKRVIRAPDQIVLVIDDCTIVPNTEELNKNVKLIKIPGLNLDNAFSNLKKRNVLGNGSVFLLMCGKYSLIRTDEFLDVCKERKCPNAVRKYFLIPGVIGKDLISKAKFLRQNILNSTENDLIIFCRIIPIERSIKDKMCENNHIWSSEIHIDIYTKYLEAVEEYNDFVDKQSGCTLDLLGESNIKETETLHSLSNCYWNGDTILSDNILQRLRKLNRSLEDQQKKQIKFMEDNKIDIIAPPSNEILFRRTVKVPTKEIPSPSNEDKIDKVASLSNEILLKRTEQAPTKKIPSAEEDKVNIKSSPSNEILKRTVKVPTTDTSSPSEDDKIDIIAPPSNELLFRRTVKVPTKEIPPSNKDKIDKVASLSNEILLKRTEQAPTKKIPSAEEDKIDIKSSPSNEILKRTVKVPTKDTSFPSVSSNSSMNIKDNRIKTFEKIVIFIGRNLDATGNEIIFNNKIKIQTFNRNSPKFRKTISEFIKDTTHLSATKTLYLLLSEIYDIAGISTNMVAGLSLEISSQLYEINSTHHRTATENLDFIKKIVTNMKSNTEYFKSILPPGSAFCVLPPPPPVIMNIETIQHNSQLQDLMLDKKNSELCFAKMKSIKLFKHSFTNYSTALISYAISELQNSGIPNDAFQEYSAFASNWIFHLRPLFYDEFQRNGKLPPEKFQIWLSSFVKFIHACLGNPVKPEEYSELKGTFFSFEDHVFVDLSEERKKSKLKTIFPTLLDINKFKTVNRSIEHAYVVGRKRLISVLRKESLFKNVEYVEWQGPINEGNVSSLIKRIGKVKHKSVCLLAFDLLCFAKETVFSMCKRLQCKAPISVMSLTTGDFDETEVDSYAMAKMMDVMSFITKLMQSFSVVVLPLFPVEMSWKKSFNHADLHLFSKTDYLVNEKEEWSYFDIMTRKLWNSFAKSNNEKYFVAEELQKFITEISNESLILEETVNKPFTFQISKFKNVLQVFLKILIGEPGMKSSRTRTRDGSDVTFQGGQPIPSISEERCRRHWQPLSPPYLPSKEVTSHREHTDISSKTRSRSDSANIDNRHRTRSSRNFPHSGEAREQYNPKKISYSRFDSGSGLRNRRKRRRSGSTTRPKSPIPRLGNLELSSICSPRSKKSRNKSPSRYRSNKLLSKSDSSVSKVQDKLYSKCENKSLSSYSYSKLHSKRTDEVQFSNTSVSVSTKVDASHDELTLSEYRPSSSTSSVSSFSLEGTISLLEQIQSKLGELGPAVMAIVNLAKKYGINSKRTMNIFTDKDNISVLQIVVDKLRVKTKFEPSADTPLFIKAVDWILHLIEIAKILTEYSTSTGIQLSSGSSESKDSH